MKQRYKKDCEMFEELIGTGRKIENKAPSVRRFSYNRFKRIEAEGFKWFTESRNFMTSLFGERFRDISTFSKCFRKYSSTTLLGTYSGDYTFIKEDISKGVGVLEGMYCSFKSRQISRRNPTLIFLTKLYFECKDWASIAMRKGK